MTLLIATDEAGYGPRLGPLVIVATAWRLPGGAALGSAHKRLEQPIQIDPIGELRIDDSKRLFTRRTSKGCPTPGASKLDLLSDAAAAWAAMPLPSEDFRRWLRAAAPADLPELSRQPWFASLAAEPPEVGQSPSPALPGAAALLTAAAINRLLIDHWSGGGLQLVGIAARILDAARFNRLLEVFGNKAELLSHTTCELAIKLWQQHRVPAVAQTSIYSDRHGGRAFYGALLQHHCPDLNLRVIHESATCSSYRLSAANDSSSTDAPAESIDWSFTVGGDRYPPVALSSIIAKSTRERLMQRFNDYFQAEAAIARPGGVSLRPTAGYSLDANRFLRDIHAIRTRRSLGDAILVRKK